MKTTKKILSVLLLSVVLITAVVVPCFAWEWNGDPTGKRTTPIIPLHYGYISNTPLWGEASSTANAWSSKTNMLNLLLDDSFDIFTTETQGDSGGQISIYGADKMLYTDKDIAINRFQTISATEYDSGGYVKLRQFADCEAPAQIQFTYNQINGSVVRHFLDVYSPGATHVDFLPYCVSYQTYSRVGDTGSNGVVATCFFKYRTTSNTWVSDAFEYTGFDDSYFIENDNKDYYQYNCNVGKALYDYVTSLSNYDPQQPFVVIETLQVGTNDDTGGVRGYRTNNLVGVYDSIYGSPFDVDEFELNGYGGNMLVNMLWSGYLSQGAVPPNAIPPQVGNVTSFLTTALGGFLDFAIVPGITLGGILATVFCICLFLAFLKIFAGG